MAVLNPDYSFLTLFDVISKVEDKRRSSEQLSHALGEALTNAQLRRILVLGIKEYYQKTHDFSIVTNIHERLSKNVKLQANNDKYVNKNTNHKDNTSSKKQPNNNGKPNCYHTQQAFKNRSLKCVILQHLNFQSIINCSKVNVEWFHDCHDPAAIYHIKIGDLFGIGLETQLENSWTSSDNWGGAQVSRYSLPIQNANSSPQYITYYANIARFRYVSSITINLWTSNQEYAKRLNKYLQLLKDKFLKIKEIEIHVSTIDAGNSVCFDIVRSLISNNKDHITGLTLVGGDPWTWVPKPLHDVLNSTIFEQLTYLSLDSLKLSQLIINKNENNINSAMYKNLECIWIANSILSIHFWTDLMTYECLFDRNFASDDSDSTLEIIFETNWVELSTFDITGPSVKALMSNIHKVSVFNSNEDADEHVISQNPFNRNVDYVRLTMVVKAENKESRENSNFTCM